MKIFITGIRGFLGSHLAASLRAAGHTVCGSARQADADIVGIRLGEPCDPANFSGCGVVIHAAHDFGRGAFARNVEGTKELFRAAREAGVVRQVFVSSYSARPRAAGEYGRAKYALERFFIDSGETVVRPGLVAGNGGLFARNVRMLAKLPVVPLVDGGRDLTAVIGIEDFCAAMAHIIALPAGAFNVFYEERPAMRRFVALVKQAAGQQARFANVPFRLARGTLDLLRLAGFDVGAELDRLDSLHETRDSDWTSDLTRILPQHRTPAEVVLSAATAVLQSSPGALTPASG